MSDFELEQYRALRSEIVRSMEDGNMIMAFGLAAAGVVLAAAIQIRGTALGFLLIAVFLPVFSSLVLSMWFAAAERVARASHFISGIEHRLGSDSSITWEKWLRTPVDGNPRRSQHFWTTEYSGIGVYIALIVAPICLSGFFGGHHIGDWTKAAVYCVMSISAAGLAVNLKRRTMRWKRWLTTSFPG